MVKKWLSFLVILEADLAKKSQNSDLGVVDERDRFDAPAEKTSGNVATESSGTEQEAFGRWYLKGEHGQAIRT